MPKTSIYLPDDLAEQVRAHGISISEVAQAALRRAIQDAKIKENVMTDIQAVAERLQATRVAAREAEEAAAARVHDRGGEWARKYATAAELEYLVTYKGSREKFQTPMSLINFAAGRSRSGPGLVTILVSQTRIPTHPGDKHWDEFHAGAREVWDAVQPLLIDIELDDHGGTVAAGSGGFAERINPEYALWLQREPSPDAPAGEHDRWAAAEPAEFL